MTPEKLMVFTGHCRATGVGSLPHTDVAAAVDAVLAGCPGLPFWPQLPKRARAEGMTEQAAAGLPGLRIEEGRLRLVQDDAFFLGVEQLFAAYEAGDASLAAMTPESAAALEPFIRAVAGRAGEAKGQIAGPITVGMAILGEDGNPILYDDVLCDVLTKFLHLRVRWQAERLASAGAAPVVFVDEPFLASYGTPFFGWSVEQIRQALEAVASGAETVGSHCCSNTDWTILLGCPRVSIVSFDAFEFADNFLVFRDALAAFLARGGTIAWGIVPTSPEALAGETLQTLRARLLGQVAKVEALGLAREQVLRQSLLTPSCGLGTRDLATAERATALVAGLAAGLRAEFLGLDT